MNGLYGLADEAEAARPGVPRNAADTGAELRIDAETLAGFLADLYASRLDARREVHAALYAEVRRVLRRGVDAGLARADYRPAAAFAEQLRRSVDVFAAFKVHRAQADMAAMLLDEDGRLRPFDDWQQRVRPIAGHQCGRWLRTEYDTAVLRAQQAADWQRFEAERDVLPNLEWMPSTSATPGADHQVFWHTIRPVDDPFWQQHRPGDRWNCKCSLEATDAPATDLPRAAGEALSQPQPGLDNNPGRDGQVFSDSHPYIAHAAPGAEEAVERIVNPKVDINDIPATLTPEADKKLFRKYQNAVSKQIAKNGPIETIGDGTYTKHLYFRKNERECILKHSFDGDELSAAIKLPELFRSLPEGKKQPIDASRENARKKIEEGVLYFVAYEIDINQEIYVLKCKVKKDPASKTELAEFPYSFKKKKENL